MKIWSIGGHKNNKDIKMNTQINNKLNQLNKKTRNIIDIYYVYGDYDFIGDEVFNIEVVVSSATPKFKRQWEYFNKYINRYNKRHHTDYTVKWVLEDDFFDDSDQEDL